MKIFIVCILLFASFGICNQNDSGSTMIIQPNWEANEIKNVKCYYSVTNEFNNFKIDTDSEIKVKNVLDDGYIVLWKIVDSKFHTAQSSSFDPIAQEDVNQLIGLIYELNFDKKGKFIGLENKDEITNNKNPEGAIKQLKIILTFFDVYDVEFDVNNIQKDYIPIRGLEDSIYYTRKSEIIDETLDKITIDNRYYLDESQNEKLLDIISDSESNYDLINFAKIILDTSFENKYAISKQSNWLINKKSIVSSSNAKIVTEFYVK
jgi:hypothetical protein